MGYEVEIATLDCTCKNAGVPIANISLYLWIAIVFRNKERNTKRGFLKLILYYNLLRILFFENYYVSA